jgi:hypothetical protein
MGVTRATCIVCLRLAASDGYIAVVSHMLFSSILPQSTPPMTKTGRRNELSRLAVLISSVRRRILLRS